MSGMTTTTESDEFREALRALGESVIAWASALRASGGVDVRRQKYITRPDPTFWYTVDPTMMNIEAEETEEDEWDWKGIDSFLSERIVTSETYGNVIRRLEDSSQKADLVRRFAYRMAYKAGLGLFVDQDRSIDTLLRDLAESPRKYVAKLWLTGVTPTESAIRISDTLSVQAATKQDLQQKVTIEAAHHGHTGFHGRIFFSCIAVCEVMARLPYEVQQYVDRLATALCLFRLGSISVPRYDISADSFSMFAGGSFGALQRATRFSYTLSKDDGPRLAQALEILMPMLPSVFEVPQARPNFLSAALDWYRESLFAQGPIEATVAWAVACLEALFLGDNPNTEISYRLAQRVIALLRCLGWNPLEVQALLKDAYDMRSKYVHGAVPKKLPQDKLQALHREVAECARVSCLAWIQMADKNRKEILKTLENALIDPDTSAQLQRWCDQIEMARR